MDETWMNFSDLADETWMNFSDPPKHRKTLPKWDGIFSSTLDIFFIHVSSRPDIFFIPNSSTCQKGKNICFIPRFIHPSKTQSLSSLCWSEIEIQLANPILKTRKPTLRGCLNMPCSIPERSKKFLKHLETFRNFLIT